MLELKLENYANQKKDLHDFDSFSNYEIYLEESIANKQIKSVTKNTINNYKFI